VTRLAVLTVYQNLQADGRNSMLHHAQHRTVKSTLVYHKYGHILQPLENISTRIYLIQGGQGEAILALVVMFKSVVKLWWWKRAARSEVVSYLGDVEVLWLVNVTIRWHHNGIGKHSFVKHKRFFAVHFSRASGWFVAIPCPTVTRQQATSTETRSKRWILDETHKVPVDDNSTSSICQTHTWQHCRNHGNQISAIITVSGYPKSLGYTSGQVSRIVSQDSVTTLCLTLGTSSNISTPCLRKK